ncbi:hypothetical protein BS50DRAFT_566974 [Corynespora cassiicola Philippines]|uniref:Uncharacterized protein n=1 Tax=Corynespora cassiicola Philippines TaxID=1448308 RepID=A0A2T2P8U6_CORCC|nr:hypothetical protein BS50DRAFT_566974 [Corynespora cassiicola Philippines]
MPDYGEDASWAICAAKFLVSRSPLVKSVSFLMSLQMGRRKILASEVTSPLVASFCIPLTRLFFPSSHHMNDNFA